MANNIVSEWLEDKIQLDYVDGTNYAQAMKAHDYAAKLDRPVEAAEWVRDTRTIMEYSEQTKWLNELAAALEAIKTNV